MNPIPAPPIANAYWVVPGQFLAGEYPAGWQPQQTAKRLGAFLAAGLTSFLDLTAPGELPPYEGLLREQAGFYDVQIRYQRHTIGDFGLPTPEGMRAILDGIDRELAAGQKVYLHCWAGVGRTGTAVGCYLVRHGLSGEQALAQLADWWQVIPKRERYPHTPETAQQAAFVRNWRE